MAKSKAKDKKIASSSLVKIETKNDLRNATVQLTKAIKGIDNDVMSMDKHRDNFFRIADEAKEKVAHAAGLVMAISNKSFELHTSNENSEKALKAATKLVATSVAKAEKVAKAKPMKAEKAIKAKPVKEEKAIIQSVTKTKPMKVKAEKIAVQMDSRPQLKVVIKKVLEKATDSLSAAEIYQAVKNVADREGFKVWSRQSLYSQLEDRKSFSKDGDKDKAVYTIASSVVEEDVENFLKKTASISSSVSAVI